MNPHNGFSLDRTVSEGDSQLCDTMVGFRVRSFLLGRTNRSIPPPQLTAHANMLPLRRKLKIWFHPRYVCSLALCSRWLTTC